MPALKTEIAVGLRRNLELVRQLRFAAGRDIDWRDRRLALKAWQSDRLRRTYPDLLASERFHDAAMFFLADLYGPKDFTRRDQDFSRMVPAMTRMLPASALEAIAWAVELDALSERLDAEMTDCLSAEPAPIDASSYARAFARTPRADRLAQMALVDRIGRALNSLVHKPMISGALAMMHGPAHFAGLGELHDFLSRGFHAYQKMVDATTFLALIRERETRLMESLYAGRIDLLQ